jgi:hypothetical protein
LNSKSTYLRLFSTQILQLYKKRQLQIGPDSGYVTGFLDIRCQF